MYKSKKLSHHRRVYQRVQVLIGMRVILHYVFPQLLVGHSELKGYYCLQIRGSKKIYLVNRVDLQK